MTRESDRPTTRRAFLGAGATTLAAGVAGCLWSTDGPARGTETERDDGERTDDSTVDQTATEQSDDRSWIPYADQFETVVHVVEDADADPNAEESIVPMLEEYAGEDTLLYFPEGRYLMDGIWLYPEFSNLGIVGEGATIVPKEGFNDYLFVLGVPSNDSRGLIFEGIEFDFRAEGTHPRPVQVQANDDFVVRDVVAHGSSGTARFDVTDEDGSGMIQRLEFPDGGFDPNPVGILVGPANVGKVTFEECHIEGFEGNGLYASPSNGPVHVLGGYYANSAIANVRVSGPAVVRDVHVRCDRAPDGFENMRGIRLRHGESALVEDCTIEMEEVTYSEGAIVGGRLLESATVRNVDIELSAQNVPAINLKSPTMTDVDAGIECENVTVTGDAPEGSTIRIVDRDESVLENLDVTQSGANRDGLHLVRSDDTHLRNSAIDVTGEAVVLDQSTIETTDVSFDE